MARPRLQRKAAPNNKTRWTASELRQRPDVPIDWVVTGLWAPGVTVFGAAPKEGKSVLALQMAAAVAKGAEVLGRKTRQCAVLYVSTDELSGDVLKRQAYPFIQGDEEIPLLIATGWKGGLEALVAFLKENEKYGAVVIDTLQKFTEMIGSGYGRDTRKIMEPLTVAFSEVGRPIAALLVHHTVKRARSSTRWEESLYGSQGITGGALNVWHLAKSAPEAPSEGPYAFNAAGRTIRHDCLRLVRRLHYFPNLADPRNKDESSHAFEWIIDPRKVEQPQEENETRAALLRVLEGAEGPIRQSDLLDKMEKYVPHSRAAIIKQVDRLVDAGLVFTQRANGKRTYIHRDSLPSPASPTLRKRLNRRP